MTNLTFYERTRDALEDPTVNQAIRVGARRFVSHRASTVSGLPEMDSLRDRARVIRAETLNKLDVFLA